MAETSIEWTDKVWNPVTGCTKVSQGCKNCYAERVFPRAYRLYVPLHWRKPARIFVNSMSDLFHEAVSDRFIALVFKTMGNNILDSERVGCHYSPKSGGVA